MNWDDVAQKRVKAPFVPRIVDELDVSNFAEEFTGMSATDSPAIVPPNVDKIFKVRLVSFYIPRIASLNDFLSFQGYSYIAPSILFTENVISGDLFSPSNNTDKKPTTSNLIGAKFKVRNTNPFLFFFYLLK